MNDRVDVAFVLITVDMDSLSVIAVIIVTVDNVAVDVLDCAELDSFIDDNEDVREELAATDDLLVEYVSVFESFVD